MEIKIKYDPVADSLYIKLKDDKVVDSEEINNIIFDYNKNGEIIGIEILNFTKSNINLNEIIVKGIESIVMKH